MVSAVVSIFIHFDTLSRIVKANIVIETDVDTIIHFDVRNGIPTFVSAQEAKSGGTIVYKGVRKVNPIDFKNRISPILALNIQKESTLKIRSITFRNYHAKAKTYDANEVFLLLDKNNNNALVTLEKGQVIIKTTAPNTSVKFVKSVRFSNTMLAYGYALLSFIVCYILFKNFSRPSWVLIDTASSASSTKSNYRLELDGIRGVAALSVLMEHTWAPFLGMGRTGVWIFFILSGYLLSQPFIKDPSSILNLNFMSRYLKKRLSRILPMYIVTVLIMLAFNGKAGELFNQLFFLKADGHLWTIPQEMFFYLTLPVIMLILYFSSKLSRYTSLSLIIIMTAILLHAPKLMPVKLYSLGSNATPLVAWFLLGICIAYINPSHQMWQARLTNKHRYWLSWFGITLFLVIVLLSIKAFTANVIFSEHRFPLYYGAQMGLACALLLFLVLLLPNSRLSALFSVVSLRSVGVIGFSFYLLHPIVIDIIRDFTVYYFNYRLVGWPMMMVAGVFTWLFASLTYAFIERPFISSRV